MKAIVILAGFLAVSAQAAEEFKLTEACKAGLEARALNVEKAKIKSEGEELASDLTAMTGISYYPKAKSVTVSVRLEDPVDGRYVRYTAKVAKTAALACEIWLERQDSSACRYSRHEGPDSMNDIRGVKFRSGRQIKPHSSISRLEERQIRDFLLLIDSDAHEISIARLIEMTDDNELSTGTLELPGGRTLAYFGAYGGDNPFGIFFEAGTTDVAGENSDGSICIR